MIRQSKQHLAAATEGYGEHFRFATTVGLLAIAAGLACLVHAMIPALCTRTCSTIIARLQTLFPERRLLEQVAQQSSGAITFVRLLLLSAVVAAAPILAGASVVLGMAIGALAFAIPLAFLLSNPELDSVDALV